MEKTKLIATVCENKDEIRQIEEFIKSGIEVYPDGTKINVNYYGKKLK